LDGTATTISLLLLRRVFERIWVKACWSAFACWFVSEDKAVEKKDRLKRKNKQSRLNDASLISI